MSESKPRFVQTVYTVPPGGAWFYQLGNVRVSSPVYEIALRRVGELLRAAGSDADAADELARFMCPHMPEWFCSGSDRHSPVITVRMATEAALPYFRRRNVPVDIITKRMEICQACPRHRRDFCLHCSGLDGWIEDMFKGRRPKLPVDEASGCCSCAGTLEAVIASVEYGKDEKGFEGAPDTCWRNRA